MYTVKQKTVFTKSIKDGSIQTCYLMHITVDTIAEIPDAKENWIAGSRCDVLEDGGHVYTLSNSREWIEVNFYNLGGESDSTDLSNYYTKSQTDERIVGQFYLVDDEIKGEIFNDYTNNVASGQYSRADGTNTKATGSYSHAAGFYTKASGAASHAEGANTTASGVGSHAEGSYTQAKESYSHAEGINTIASGSNSHAEGDGTVASSGDAHAEGCRTVANGSYSHAEGYCTVAKGEASHSAGFYTQAYGHYSYVIGKYNIIDSDNKYAFIIGNGTSSSKLSNAFSIDWNGNIYVNNSDTPVNVLDLLNRISALEDKVAELENSENT